MKTIALAFVISVVVEALVSYGETIYEYFEMGDVKKAVKQLCAIALAILFAVEAHITVLAWLSSITMSPLLDMIVSGVFMSRGSNYLFDIAKLIARAGRDFLELEEVDEDEFDEDEDYDEDQTQLVVDDLEEEEGEE